MESSPPPYGHHYHLDMLMNNPKLLSQQREEAIEHSIFRHYAPAWSVKTISAWRVIYTASLYPNFFDAAWRLSEFASNVM